MAADDGKRQCEGAGAPRRIDVVYDLPEELCAITACYLGADEAGDYFRQAAGGVKLMHTDANSVTCVNGLRLTREDAQRHGISAVVTDGEGAQWWYRKGELHRDGDLP